MNPRMQKVDRYDSVWSAFRKVNANFDELLSAMREGSTNGMTLRDYFAAKAMQALLANQAIVDAITDGAIAYAAMGSYAIADAMLAAREGKS